MKYKKFILVIPCLLLIALVAIDSKIHFAANLNDILVPANPGPTNQTKETSSLAPIQQNESSDQEYESSRETNTSSSSTNDSEDISNRKDSSEMQLSEKEPVATVSSENRNEETISSTSTNEQIVSEAPIMIEEEPEQETTDSIQTANTPNTLIYNEYKVPLIDCQDAAEAPFNNMAGFWSGNGSTTDNLPTHIIGHNPGIFSFVVNIQVGNTLTLIDRDGLKRQYTVYAVMEVNDDALDRNGVTQWDSIIDQPGESISLQTCIDDYWNKMILAR